LNLTETNIVDGIDGNEWIKITRQKSDIVANMEIMMNETTPFRRKLTHCFGAN
jgi:hypothetical protein